MSTRGFITFVAGGTEKTTYNHSDSYPDWLGVNVLSWLRTSLGSFEPCCGLFSDQYGCSEHGRESLTHLRDRITALRVVDQNVPPTAEEIESLKGYANSNVGRQDLSDWYCLLRETQGYPGAILAAGVMTDASDFPADSLFAEWGYVVDTDAKTFEVYEGFQKAKHDKGRFAERPQRERGEYWPVALVASWPLDALPTNEDFNAKFQSDEDDE